MDFGRATPANVASNCADVPFEAFARFSLDGLAFVDEHQHIAAWNDAAVSVTGISRERALGSTLDALFTNAERLRTAHDVRLSPADDPLATIAAAYFPVAHGAIVSFGPQRRFAAIEHVKNEILASVSHELKTPLAVIKAFATTLRKRPDAGADERNDYLATIEEQADVLTRAVDDLMLAARADAHDLPVRREETPLSSILDGAVRELGASGTGRTLERNGDADICGDPDLLRHAFAQLLDNAFKYSTSPAPVSVDALSRSSETVVRIQDRGVGIAPDHLPYIFDRFYRVEGHLTAQNAGTGLGLHVASAIVRAHGGTIRAESEPGIGTTIVVTLPVRA